MNLGPEEQQMAQALAGTLLDPLRGAFGLAFNVERGKRAAYKAAVDVFALSGMLDQFTPEGRDKVWQIALIRVPDIIGGSPEVLVEAGVKLTRSAWKNNNAPMFGATVLALATSPIARAFLYYEGYELRFRLLTVVEQPQGEPS